METRRIGSLEVSVVGLGTNNFGRRLDETGTDAVVHAALDAGITFIDTADIYGGGQSEEFIGRALGARRAEAVIATKFGIMAGRQDGQASPAYVREAVEASLRRLNTDVIDLYQLHRPDPSTPIADTLAAMDELVRAGKVREIGCSNFSGEQIREAEADVQAGAARFVSVQNEYNLVKREPEYSDVLPECERLKLGYLPYSPLAAPGLLSGKYRQGQPLPEKTRITTGAAGHWLTDCNLALVDALARFAEAQGRTLLELTFGWLLARPVVASVIAGAMRPEQIHANASAANWTLTAADLTEIDKILTGPA